jgi:hypothetical protein
VTASEFAFLAVGLVLGIATGAALVDLSRGRPSNSREVRVTVAPGSLRARRSATLAEDAFAGIAQPPARGGPGDHGDVFPEPAIAPAVGTAVRSGSPSPATETPSPAPDPLPAWARPAVGIPIHRETDPALASLRAAAARSAEQAMTDQRMTIAAILDPAQTLASASRNGSEGDATPAVGVATVESAESGVAGGAAAALRAAADPSRGAAGQTAIAGAPKADDDCAEVRRIADERCTISARARDQATAAQEALHLAQRQYDDHHSQAEQAAVEADPRQMRSAKEAAQNAFRHARGAATTREGVEGAARDWLTEINRINHDARDAAGRLQRERNAANLLVTQIERLTVEADAARISAETAEAACLSARQAVADCQEAATPPARSSFIPSPATTVGFGAGGGLPAEETELEPAFSLRGDEEPAILRLVRGEHEVLTALVDALAGGDAAERDRWQRLLAQFVEVVIARAIEESALTFPIDDAFWGAFSLAQNRDVLTALSSLGYRYDGLGGWVDDRMPSQRDLSLATGYAGLDPMRVRHWPTEAETADLLRDVAVAADEYLAETAGSLTLGELVSALGRRADDLTELWNDWGRVRPLLLSS